MRRKGMHMDDEVKKPVKAQTPTEKAIAVAFAFCLIVLLLGGTLKILSLMFPMP